MGMIHCGGSNCSGWRGFWGLCTEFCAIPYHTWYNYGLWFCGVATFPQLSVPVANGSHKAVFSGMDTCLLFLILSVLFSLSSPEFPEVVEI